MSQNLTRDLPGRGTINIHFFFCRAVYLQWTTVGAPPSLTPFTVLMNLARDDWCIGTPWSGQTVK